MTDNMTRAYRLSRLFTLLFEGCMGLAFVLLLVTICTTVWPLAIATVAVFCLGLIFGQASINWERRA